MQEHAILQVSVRGKSKYRYYFQKPGELGKSSYGDVNVDVGALDTFCNMMKAEIEKKRPNRSEIVKIGRELHKNLFDAEAHPKVSQLIRALRTLKSPLIIESEDINIYWELLCDPTEEEFWGGQYLISRRLVDTHKVHSEQKEITKRRALIIANPNADDEKRKLNAASVEARQVRTKLKRWQYQVEDADYLIGDDATLTAVFSQLMEKDKKIDIFHFAGHVQKGSQEDEYVLQLNSNQRFTSTSIKRNMTEHQPFVFINGCKSSGDGHAFSETVKGLADAFLDAGALAVVASLFDIPDQSARLFAEFFYDSLLSGDPIGKAMQYAKIQTMRSSKIGAVWGSYVLYGNPYFQIENTTEELSRLMGKIDMSPDQLDYAGRQILDNMRRYAPYESELGSKNFFVSLCETPETQFQIHLEANPDLKKNCSALCMTITRAWRDREAKSTTHILFSVYLESLLKQALALSKEDGRDVITELDIIKTYIKTGGGKAGKTFVTQFDGDLDSLSCGEMKIGSLSKNDCTLVAWDILKHAAGLLQQEEDFITSYDLLQAFGARTEGHSVRAFHRMGIKFGGKKENQEKHPYTFPKDIPVSTSTQLIFNLAKWHADELNRDLIDEVDLWYGYVIQGGGTSGEHLRKKMNVMLEAGLPLSTFDHNGRLDRDKIDEELSAAFDLVLLYAQQIGHVIIGRRHWPYAFLKFDNGLFNRLLVAQRVERLPLLYEYDEAAADSPTELELDLSFFSTSFVRQLYSAEMNAAKAGDPVLSMPVFLLNYLVHATEGFKSRLRKHKADWDQLLADLDNLTP